MKHLCDCDDIYEADNISLQLESRGIPTYISGKNSSNIGVAAFGMIRPNVHVLFDEQHADAIALLTNPNHIVSQPLNQEEIQQLKIQSDKIPVAFIFRAIALITLACIALLLTTYFCFY